MNDVTSKAKPPRGTNRRGFLKLGTFVAGAAVGLYTWRWEPHWVELRELSMPVANLPASLEGAHLVQMSDLHIGTQVEESFLIEAFDRVRALKPKFVVYTGDFVSYERQIFRRTERVFPKLACGTLGSFGVLGNHDYGPGWAHPEIAGDLAKLAEAAGVSILRNTVAEAGGLQVVGLDDLWARQFKPQRAFAAIQPGKPTVVLSHNPDTVDLPGWDAYRGWVLCGHTHGGQCKPPFLPPPLLPVENRKYTAGIFELPGERRMYINRGLGHLLQVRINARPEITMFRLTRGANSSVGIDLSAL